MATAKDIKTQPTAVSVKDFVAAVENDTRRKDAEQLLKLFAKITGWKPKMWGPTIIGYGTYHYTYDTGREGDACVVGFSPRKASLSVYWGGCEGDEPKALFAKLGKHKMGAGGCLYINKLADVDMAVLEKIVSGGLAHMKKKWPVKGS
ncbi:DUF1801 domain-containing protein [Hyalangium rubrum]|uniref:DUF1801 domain-containing protein n=1 Tax=Hyalangium rubrum TaxID=3103134 RepID=A0ABU5H1R1_9BACT|nr:DUF1801 domain-containing protein [Hyalangium sp. s54d21]MDY7227047.1 DUF1801 domain-containing protein [Hyalangium sp. s54d21]